MCDVQVVWRRDWELDRTGDSSLVFVSFHRQGKGLNSVSDKVGGDLTIDFRILLLSQSNKGCCSSRLLESEHEI